jgi:hypothetical protein
MVGSYYYEPSLGSDSVEIAPYYHESPYSSLKLVGKLHPDFSFYWVERTETDSITGFFEGKLSLDFKFAAGKRSDKKEEKFYNFEIKQVTGKSYWDYIKKNRGLYEYKNLDEAIENKHKVLSIDVENQHLKKLPNELSQLDKIVSINLLGNYFESFPTVLSQLTTLDEISLSSNRLKKISNKIGRLKNLRILIMNFNQLKKLPKEIGELTNLLYLDIGNNQLTSLPEEIKYLTNLQELHINRNQLSETEKQRIRTLLPKCVIHFE